MLIGGILNKPGQACEASTVDISCTPNSSILKKREVYHGYSYKSLFHCYQFRVLKNGIHQSRPDAGAQQKIIYSYSFYSTRKRNIRSILTNFSNVTTKKGEFPTEQ